VFHPLDAEKGAGPELAAAFEVKGYPSFILTDASGEVIDRWMGYDTPAALIATLGEAKADPTTVAQKLARYEAAPSARDAATLGRIHAARGQRDEALGYYRKAQELDPAADHSSAIFELLAGGYLRKTGVTAQEVQAAADAILASPSRTPTGMADVALFMGDVARSEGDVAMGIPYLQAALEATGGSSDEAVRKRHAALLIEHALHVDGDKDKAVELKRAAMPEGWTEDANRLNAYAWWAFENRVDLPEAEKLARRGVELAKPGREKGMILDTLAEIVAVRGDHAEAASLIEQAIAEDPKSKHYPEQLERFQKPAGEPLEDGGAR
jgi:tetratricopeptide (TPR) repeat protein